MINSGKRNTFQRVIYEHDTHIYITDNREKKIFH